MFLLKGTGGIILGIDKLVSYGAPGYTDDSTALNERGGVTLESSLLGEYKGVTYTLGV